MSLLETSLLETSLLETSLLETSLLETSLLETSLLETSLLETSLLERYRSLYDYEKDCNDKMLAMIESVPEASRNDARFQQAVSLAGHLAACRENWLDRMSGEGLCQADWFNAACEFASLEPRFCALQTRWTDYLAGLEGGRLAEEFEFPVWGGTRFHMPTEVQIVQLCGHACYHRGQIALLVDQLGGETVDTDYVFWAVPSSADV